MEGERLTVDELLPADKSGEVIDLTANKQDITAEPLLPEGPKGYEAAAKSLSNNNVQVYSLDGAQPEPFKPTATAYSTPNVQVFPLDQAMADSMNLGRQPARSGGPLTPMPGAKPSVAANGNGVVYFDHGSAQLNDQALEAVEAVAWSLASQGAGPLSVTGYASTKAVETDPVRRKMINLKLSMDRAFAVARALIDRGVNPDLIHTSGWGEEGAIGDDAASRRVEIKRVSN